jgi:hypothetical protein
MHVTWHRGVALAPFATHEAVEWLVDEMVAAGAHYSVVTPAGMFGDALYHAEGPDYAGLYVTIHPAEDAVELLRELLGTGGLVAVLTSCLVEVSADLFTITVSVVAPDRCGRR